MKQKPGYSNQT